MRVLSVSVRCTAALHRTAALPALACSKRIEPRRKAEGGGRRQAQAGRQRDMTNLHAPLALPVRRIAIAIAIAPFDPTYLPTYWPLIFVHAHAHLDYYISLL